MAFAARPSGPPGACLLGTDAGNTGVKAVLFDEEGRELARAPRDGGHEPGAGPC